MCEQCHEQMAFEIAKGPDEGLNQFTFCCPKCKNRISMINNIQETNLLRTLGLNIGGRKTPHQPLEMVHKSPAQGDDEALLWTEEAENRMEKVPSMVKGMARKAIESHARQKGYNKITSEVIDEAKSKWSDKID